MYKGCVHKAILKKDVSLFLMNIDDQQLKALELNSWQLLRLLQAQLPGLSCEISPCDGFSDDQECRKSKCSGNMENMICCLYWKAAVLHSSWRSKDVSRWVHDAIYHNNCENEVRWKHC